MSVKSAESKWNEQQEQAINAKGRSIIVSAAAGSGKTSVLIERLIRIISDTENPVEIEKMVVVTFTNAAAAEMKQRLSAALSKKIMENPMDSWLARQQSFLNSASISTIHSFCFDLIRENTVNLALGSDFRILDEAEQRLALNTVLSEYMEELYETSPDEMQFLKDTFCGNTDYNLVKIILGLYNNITAIPFYKNWLKSTLPSFYKNKQKNKSDYLEIIKSKLYDYHIAMNSIVSAAAEFGEQTLSDVLQKDMDIIDTAIDRFENEGFEEMLDYIESSKHTKWPSPPKDIDYRTERDNLKVSRKKINDNLKKLPELRSIVVNSDADHAVHEKAMEILSVIICELDNRFYDYKMQENAIGFDDAECIALNLLAECDEDGKIRKTPLGETVSDNYKVIMVDEFQDSNDRQDMIFRLLSKNGSAESYGDNLFFVGDVKQSIYRFRQANPDNFMKVMKSFVPYDENGSENSYIRLSSNYRSSDDVVNFVNFVFENIMSEQAGEIDYTQSEFLVRKADFPEYNRDTTVMLIDKSSGDDAEALYIAAKIRKMLDDKVMVSDGKGGLRPCCEKDFCILLRKKKSGEKVYLKIYEQALEEYGISSNCENLSGYLKSREISVLINILKVIDNPMQDIPVVSVLMSPMFMLDSDDITRLRLFNRKSKLYHNIANILGKYNKNKKDDKSPEQENETQSNEFMPDKQSDLYKKLEYFYDLVSEIRLVSSYSSLAELIQLIYDRTDFTSVISLYKDSERKRANLRVLLEYANSYDSVSNGGVGGFVRYIDRISENEGDFKSVSNESSVSNTVSIKTMHKSKGLEYPFVFIAETDTSFNTMDEKEQVQFSSDIGIGFRLQNKSAYEKFRTIPYELINNSNKSKMISEEMRILYVALTRAKERLFITLDMSDSTAMAAERISEDINRNKGITPKLAGSVNSMMEWLLMSFLVHKDGRTLSENLGTTACYSYDKTFPIVFEHQDKPEKYQEITDIKVGTDVKSDENTVKLLKEKWNFKYDDSLVNVTSKLSVSDVSKKSSSLNMPLSKPHFVQDNSMSAAERGTAVHTFLQFSDFEKLEKDFESEKERVANLGHITKKQASVIKEDDIKAFLESDLYKEIKSCERVLRERKFLVSIDDLKLDGELSEFAENYKNTDGMLNGIMDMIIERKDSLILVDYKTDSVEKGSELARRYRNQLMLYKKALEAIQDKPVESTVIYSFCLKEVIEL